MESKKKEIEEVIEEKVVEDEVVEKPSQDIAIRKCKRCGFKYAIGKEIIYQQQKCCPECMAPVSWSC